MRQVIAVHAGAGFFPKDIHKKTLQLCEKACKQTLNSTEPKSDVDLCTSAIEILENSPLTNTGFGSNLTSAETVECDACIMEGVQMNFGAIGAVSGIYNPILVAKELIDLNKSSESPLVRPLMLVGQGAVDFVHSSSSEKLATVAGEKLISEASLGVYRKALRSIAQSNCDANFLSMDGFTRLDTVGAVSIDANGCVAAGCSSGGVLLKTPGRVGQAATFGAGCWAQNGHPFSIAASTSGCGEYIIRTNLARSVCEDLICPSAEQTTLPEALKTSFERRFMQNLVLKNCQTVHKLAGILVLRVNHELEEVEIAWAHNTSQMCVGFSKGSKIDVSMSCLNDDLPLSVKGIGYSLL